MKFIDQLRKVTNGSDADNRVIDECMTIIKEFKPDAFTEIPHDVKNKLMDAARHQKHSCIFDDDSYISFLKTYNNIVNHKVLKKLQNICQKAEYNSLFTFERNNHYIYLQWKYLDNDCKFEFSNEYGELEIRIHFGLKTCAKILENAGFIVDFNSRKQTLKVEW